MRASENGNKEIVELLLSAGADVNLQNKVCKKKKKKKKKKKHFMNVMIINALSFCYFVFTE